MHDLNCVSIVKQPIYSGYINSKPKAKILSNLNQTLDILSQIWTVKNWEIEKSNQPEAGPDNHRHKQTVFYSDHNDKIE